MNPKVCLVWRLLRAALAGSWAVHKHEEFIAKPQPQQPLQIHLPTLLVVMVSLAIAQNLASAATELKAGDRRQIGPIPFCWCPPGTFIMGSPPNEPERRADEAQVQVTLTKGFWMAKFETTQGDWKRVMGSLPG